MQIPKISLWLGVLTLGAVLSAQAVDNSDQAAARAALEAKMQELDAQQPVPPANPPKVQPVPTTYLGKNLGLSPILAPALPISASKQSQLEELLVKYKADQITPEEYHKARAQILAAP